ncbi:FAD-binding oxidoreductase [Gulosibacter sp. 10]|uniref:NAD(P)/FAD-dependent oxidoreductase n=1 Tax=Gulosibacter sp. 10 TaxID=1255570 RepID=UPI00097F230A|nr:FAD-binding oxidoreductase [Gulosibacter sp. 10]SJM54935.1 FAD dependent oxidoreductase [Gulosibacter sp. 10]
MSAILNGEVSHWMRSASPRRYHSPLPDERQDLLIVGAGLTGLWAAYFAAKEHPDWKITVVEAKRVGYEASGRNGGWMSTLLPGNRAVWAKRVNKQGGDGIAAMREFQQAVNASIHEALDIMRREGIDAGQAQGGNLHVAQTPAGYARLKGKYETDLRYGYSPEDIRLLDAEETRERINVDGALGSLHYQHTTAVDPARMVAGLAEAVDRLGVRICEETAATRVEKQHVLTNRGPVIANTIFVCAEAATGKIESALPGFGPREVIPVNSSIIATETLPERFWKRIGWDERDCLMDSAHTFIYAQRTQDDRIAIGGRGTPYFFGSKLTGEGEVDERTIRSLRQKLAQLFPGETLPIAHAWRGSIGVTRDWCAGLFFDRESRVGVVRGYAGHGVSSTLLAAKTLLDRAEGRSTELVRMPWNDHRAKKWEPEPIRWLGVHTMYRLFEYADAQEARSGKPKTSLIAQFGSRLAGLHE